MPAPFPSPFTRAAIGLLMLLALPACNFQAVQADPQARPSMPPSSETAASPSSDDEDPNNILLNPLRGPLDQRTLDAITPAGDPAYAGQPAPLPDGITVPLPLNPKPQRQYRMAGRVPDTLDVEVESRYFPYADDTDDCIAYLRPFKGALPESTLSITAPERVTRTKEGFEASIVIDRFEESPCQFVYRDTAVRVYKKADQLPLSDDERRILDRFTARNVVTADRYFHEDTVPVCMPDDRSACRPDTWHLAVNFDPAKPVYLLCKRYIPSTADPLPTDERLLEYVCYGPPKSLYKRMHGLKAHNRSPIRVDIYDLDTELPPFPVDYSKQPTQGDKR